MTWLIVMALVGGLVGQPVGATAGPPKDFAVRLTFGCATMDVIDTFKGEYIRDVGPNFWEARTWLAFSRKQKAELSELVVAAAFFEIPSDLWRQTLGGIEPSSTFVLKVRSAGRQHQVTWNDGGDQSGPLSPAAIALRTLSSRIIQFAQTSRVEELPGSSLICL